MFYGSINPTYFRDSETKKKQKNPVECILTIFKEFYTVDCLLWLLPSLQIVCSTRGAVRCVGGWMKSGSHVRDASSLLAKFPPRTQN